ncbi:MAG: LuxR C-terminal-related transcriptional regulator [Cyanobacteria bacterium J06650_10]
MRPQSLLPTPPEEPLNRQEPDVIHLLNTELSSPEIASERFVVLSTICTHTKSIYSKLNIINHRTAIKQAKELDLISRPYLRSFFIR